MKTGIYYLENKEKILVADKEDSMYPWTIMSSGYYILESMKVSNKSNYWYWCINIKTNEIITVFIPSISENTNPWKQVSIIS